MIINFFVRYFYLVVNSFSLSEQIGNQYHCHQCFLIAASDLTALLVVVMVVPAVVAAVATAALLTLLLLPLKLLFIQSICCVCSINSLCAYYANCWLQKNASSDVYWRTHFLFVNSAYLWPAPAVAICRFASFLCPVHKICIFISFWVVNQVYKVKKSFIKYFLSVTN